MTNEEYNNLKPGDYIIYDWICDNMGVDAWSRFDGLCFIGFVENKYGAVHKRISAFKHICGSYPSLPDEQIILDNNERMKKVNLNQIEALKSVFKITRGRIKDGYQ